ncbi:MAG: hypothetical protein WCH84_02380 [Verrucomicrobiota bacterium]
MSAGTAGPSVGAAKFKVGNLQNKLLQFREKQLGRIIEWIMRGFFKDDHLRLGKRCLHLGRAVSAKGLIKFPFQNEQRNGTWFEIIFRIRHGHLEDLAKLRVKLIIISDKAGHIFIRWTVKPILTFPLAARKRIIHALTGRQLGVPAGGPDGLLLFR